MSQDAKLHSSLGVTVRLCLKTNKKTQPNTQKNQVNKLIALRKPAGQESPGSLLRLERGVLWPLHLGAGCPAMLSAGAQKMWTSQDVHSALFHLFVSSLVSEPLFPGHCGQGKDVGLKGPAFKSCSALTGSVTLGKLLYLSEPQSTVKWGGLLPDGYEVT